MLNKIINTIGTRAGGALISLLIMVLTSQYLGSDGKGAVGILMLNITIVVLVTSLVGGPSMVYLVPRIEPFKLVVPAYVWALLGSALVTVVYFEFDELTVCHPMHLFTLSFLQSMTTIHHQVLIGREDIKGYNILSLFNAVVLIISLVILIMVMGDHSLDAYIMGMYISSVATFLLSIPVAWKHISITPLSGLPGVTAKAFRYGVLNQSGAIAQMFNYRISFFILKSLTGEGGLSRVGIYSNGVQISEALWIISRSIALVQYSRISNSNDTAYARRLTIQLLKLSFGIVALGLIPLILAPESLYLSIFGDDFTGIKSAIQWLAPGIASFAASGILSGYFAGVGKHHVNAVSSGLGMVITLGLGFYLIPILGVAGASLTASFSYIVSTVYQLVIFIAQTKTPVSQLLPTSKDIQDLKSVPRDYLDKW